MTAVERPNRAVALAAELSVLRALEAAGKRARLPRAIMGQLTGVPTHLVHTHVPLATRPEDCDRLLAGVWLHLELVVGDERLVRLLDAHTRALIVAGQPLDREALLRNLEAAYA